MEEQEAKLDALRTALIAGEESGRSTSFDFDDFIASKRAVTVWLEAGAIGDRAEDCDGAASPSPRSPRRMPGPRS